MKIPLPAQLATALILFSTSPLPAQVKCEPTGGIGGIRVDGELVEFETSVRAANADWTHLFLNHQFVRANHGSFERSGNLHTTHQLLSGVALEYTTVIMDQAPGGAKIDVKVRAVPPPTSPLAHAGAPTPTPTLAPVSAWAPPASTAPADTFYCLELSPETFEHGTVELLDSANTGTEPPKAVLDPQRLDAPRELLRGFAKSIRFKTDRETIEVATDTPVEILVRRDGVVEEKMAPNQPPVRHAGETLDPAAPVKATDAFQIYFRLSGPLPLNESVTKTFTVRAAVQPDVAPITLTLDTEHPGREFDGIGGNFRLQFPDKDPQVVDYCLKNLRVSWARIAMWWGDWQANADEDPVARARAGKLGQRLVRQMELARRLAQQHIPVIVSEWFPPGWAVHPPPIAHGRSVTLDEQKAGAICESIGKYLLYLKSEYGVDAELFSFNEPDTGVDVLMTPEEQAFWALHLGRHFASLGLRTRFLLGDTAHGTAEATHLLDPTIANPEIWPYVGAVAFHTYRGCSDRDLAAWKDAAARLHLPLLVTEASLDGAGHMYPAIFTEDWFQLYEADLMTNICGKTGTSLMMVWQLTADYSPLAGGGIYGDEGPLRPTMRFWFLQQLGSTPAGAFNLPIVADRPRLSCAAYGDIANGSYAIHIVNTGATRRATIVGLPRGLKTLRTYLTDTKRGLVPGPEVPVREGRAEFALQSAAFTTFRGQIPASATH